MWGFADGHCDTISRLVQTGEGLWENTGHWDLKRMTQFAPSLQIFALWLPTNQWNTKKVFEMMANYQKQMQENAEWIVPVQCGGEINRVFSEGKHCAVLAIEGGDALHGQLPLLQAYHERGVRVMTLTWNDRNPLGDGVKATAPQGGLTTFGRTVVQEMERMGMLVDVSHLAEAGFWDVVRLAKKPFFASHSNARAICQTPRNLSDEQLRAIAYGGGVVGINFYPTFLTEGQEASINHIVAHVAHMLTVMGEDFIALGSDFDGIEKTPVDCTDVSQVAVLRNRLQEAFGEKITNKIMRENLLRLLHQVI